MPKTVPMIGLDSAEVPWVRLLIFLLRHPDPVVCQLTCRALEHIEGTLSRVPADTLDHAG